ncbi:MAG: hypothetical protein DHS20C20_34080 [Ardenticatenaceae bacterium]|nr:MAG: hypothetical protein DHS20C20_34080 [Ardenticatenaceae bacterium]
MCQDLTSTTSGSLDQPTKLLVSINAYTYYVKAKKPFELDSAKIWLLLKKTTDKLLIGFQNNFCGLQNEVEKLCQNGRSLSKNL